MTQQSDDKKVRPVYRHEPGEKYDPEHELYVNQLYDEPDLTWPQWCKRRGLPEPWRGAFEGHPCVIPKWEW